MRKSCNTKKQLRKVAIAEVYRVADGQKIQPGTSLIRLSANDGTVLYAEVEEVQKTGCLKKNVC